MAIRYFFLQFLLLFALSIFAQPYDSITVDGINDVYNTSGFHRFLFGNHYREVWTAPVRLPVLDLKTAKGGLIPTELGGGQQTRSLRVKDPDSNIYVLRTVDKFPRVLGDIHLPVADFLIKDAISASFPYGAIIAARLEEYAHVNHTRPIIMYIPEDADVGEWTDLFAGQVILFEERAEDFKVPLENFNYATDVIDTDEIIPYREESWERQPDPYMLVKIRLIDMLIGDWDRHGGQWNWGAVEGDSAGLYYPIPEDRDNSFFDFRGVLPWLARRRWAIPKFQRYDKEIDNLPRFNQNAQGFDRFFLNELTLNDWLEAASFLQKEFTDEKIEEAVTAIPPEIYKLEGERLVKLLKIRRDDLQSYANEYYRFLSKDISIIGSAQQETFEVTPVEDNLRVRVKVAGMEDPVYERVVSPDETNEIRLYGMGGGDRYEIGEIGEAGIWVRIIGSGDTDSVINHNKIGKRRFVVVYDSVLALSENSEPVRHYTRSDSITRDYYNGFAYDMTVPLIQLAYNGADGFKPSLGFEIRKPGFPKDTYEAKHHLLVSYPFLRKSLEVQWHSHFSHLIHKWDLDIPVEILGPDYPFYYGVLRSLDRHMDLSAPRLNQVKAQPSLKRHFWHHLDFQWGLEASYTRGTFAFSHVMDYQSELKEASEILAGPFANLYFSMGEISEYPRNAIRIGGGGRLLMSPNTTASVREIYGSLNAYLTVNKLRLTWAIRLGAETQIGGTYVPFFERLFMGRERVVRGIPEHYYVNTQQYFANGELRWNIAGPIGVLAFTDYGYIPPGNLMPKVDAMGYGGGLFLKLGKQVISAHYARSSLDEQIEVRWGFFY